MTWLPTTCTGRIVLEFVGVNRNIVKTTSNVLIFFKCNMCISYGISENIYSCETKKLGSRWQSNAVSATMCRIQSRLVLNPEEQLKIGAQHKSTMRKLEE